MHYSLLDINRPITSMAETAAFDGVDGAGPYRPGAFPRRLTSDTLAALRRRRTGPARGLMRPLRRPRGGADGESDDDEDEEDSGDEDESLVSALCCWCVGPRCCVSACMLSLAFVIYSSAVAHGVLKQHTYEQLITPIRRARQRMTHKTPTGADDGFILFDRNADGVIDTADLAIVAKMTTGEHPTEEQLRGYIRRGDTDGDGALNETEYLEMLHREREVKAGKGSRPPR